MALKTQKKNKDERFGGRCTNVDKNAMQTKANLYAEGDLTAWCIYAAKNYVPSGDELEDETKPKKRKKK